MLVLRLSVRRMAWLRSLASETVDMVACAITQGTDSVPQKWPVSVDKQRSDQPLTPPWVSPPIRCCCSAKNSAITGSDTSTAPAAKCPHSVA